MKILQIAFMPHTLHKDGLNDFLCTNGYCAKRLAEVVACHDECQSLKSEIRLLAFQRGQFSSPLDQEQWTILENVAVRKQLKLSL